MTAFFVIIRNGFIRMFRLLFFTSGIIISALLTGVLIVLPLWLFATRLPRAYTAVTLSVTSLFTVVFIIRTLYRRYRNYGSMNDFLLHQIVPKLKICGIVVVFIAGLYGAAFLYTLSFAAAVPVSVLFLLWVAYVVSQKKSGHSAE